MELSRRLRLKTGEELAKMSSKERIRFLNEFVENHPELRKVRKVPPPPGTSRGK